MSLQIVKWFEIPEWAMFVLKIFSIITAELLLLTYVFRPIGLKECHDITPRSLSLDKLGFDVVVAFDGGKYLKNFFSGFHEINIGHFNLMVKGAACE